MSFFKNKKILVTGGSGFVGVNLISKLVPLGAVIRATYYNSLPKVHVNQVEYIQCDLTNKDHYKDLFSGIDYVFMCAANSSGAAVMEKMPLVHLTPNVVMNALCLEAAYKENVEKFIFISSNTVYPVTTYPVKESDANFNFYEKYHIVGWMKSFSEIMCDMYAKKIKKPMNTYVVRPGNLYGPYDKYGKEESKVIAALIRRAVERESPYVVWGDGLDVKDFLYIDDFIDGMLAVAQLDSLDTPINIASGVPSTVRDVLNHVLNITGYVTQPIFDSTMPTMIPFRKIDVTLAERLINWKPKHNLEQGLRKTIEWYVDNKAV